MVGNEQKHFGVEMTGYITADSIRALREVRGLTQKELAEQIGVTDKAISKWETGRGLPDVTLLEPLSAALGVSLAELLAGERIVNTNRAANLSRAHFYVCPLCGNVLFSAGEAHISCCGIALPPLEAEEETDELHITSEVSDGEVYLSIDHPMNKDHYVSFMAYVTTDQVFLRKLYPEQTADARFPYRGMGKLFAFCNHHGLVSKPLKPVKRSITQL